MRRVLEPGHPAEVAHETSRTHPLGAVHEEDALAEDRRDELAHRARRDGRLDDDDRRAHDVLRHDAAGPCQLARVGPMIGDGCVDRDDRDVAIPERQLVGRGTEPAGGARRRE